MMRVAISPLIEVSLEIDEGGDRSEASIRLYEYAPVCYEETLDWSEGKYCHFMSSLTV